MANIFIRVHRNIEAMLSCHTTAKISIKAHPLIVVIYFVIGMDEAYTQVHRNTEVISCVPLMGNMFIREPRRIVAIYFTRYVVNMSIPTHHNIDRILFAQ